MANLTNLVALMSDLVPGVAQLAQTQSKVEELKKFIYMAEGPSDQVGIIRNIHLGLPASASQADRAAAITPTRATDALTQTTLYTPFRTRGHLTDKELNSLVNKGEFADFLADGLVKCWANVTAAVKAAILAAIGTTTTMPNPGGTTDAWGAIHTLVGGGTYTNFGTAALDTTALSAGIDAMVLEQDWADIDTNPTPSVLVASSASKINAAVNSAYGSSALDANIGSGMDGVVLPGLGTAWMISSGAHRNGLRIDFAGAGQFGKPGEPWVGMPYEADDGRITIPYGCDFALSIPTYQGAWISNGTT